MTHITGQTRIVIQRRFHTAIANLRVVAVWYCPETGNIHVRRHPFNPEAIHRNEHGRKAIPTSAIRIGDYAAPFPSRLFLDDLEETLRRLYYKDARQSG